LWYDSSPHDHQKTVTKADSPAAGMRPTNAVARRAIALAIHAAAALGIWLAAGRLAVASSRPYAARVGLLPPVALLLVLSAVAAASALSDIRLQRSLALLLVLPAMLPWLPFRMPPAALVWAGPLTLFLWSVAALALLRPALARFARSSPWLTSPERGPWIAALLAFAVYVSVYAQVRSRMPSGDEPYYLVITQSILSDHDIRIANNYERRDYAAFYPGQLKPDYLRPARSGAIYSIHPPGLPLLVAPAFALLGYRGVVLFLTLLSAGATALAPPGASGQTANACVPDARPARRHRGVAVARPRPTRAGRASRRPASARAGGIADGFRRSSDGSRGRGRVAAARRGSVAWARTRDPLRDVGFPHLEPPGLWIRGHDSADLVVSPDAGAQARLFLRNNPKANRVNLVIGKRRETLDLGPGEERVVELPVEDGRAVRLRVESTASFRPADVDPASTDHRALGCWIEIR
jgi:hypothetical protein